MPPPLLEKVNCSETRELYFVIPAFNEGKSIGRVLQALKELFPGSQIVVVDDGSADDTPQRAALSGATVISLPFNAGYGVALQTGFLWARRHRARFVVTLDADGQHDPGEVPKLAAPVLAEEADLVLGSRYLPESRCYRVPWPRRLGSWLFAQVVSLLMRQRITDPTTGFQCMNAKVLDLYVGLPDFPSMSPDADLILYAHLRGCRIRETPVVMHEDAGKDSMHGFFKSIFYVPKMLTAILGVLLAHVSFTSQE